jgi:hypothetical protein
MRTLAVVAHRGDQVRVHRAAHHHHTGGLMAILTAWNFDTP